MIKVDSDLVIKRDDTGELETVVTIEMLKKHLRLQTSVVGDGSQRINLYYDDELITSTSVY